MIQPVHLGLPEKFDGWRTLQWEAVDHGLLSERRSIGQAIPTGGGKSLVYISQAIVSGERSAILTSSKGLQDQLVKDFSSIGSVANLKGKENYKCSARPNWTCKDGSVGRCPHKGTDRCDHTKAYFKALTSKIVITNYSCWMAIHKYGIGLGEFGHLFMDEAHMAFDELSNAVQIRFGEHEVNDMLGVGFPKKSEDLDTWKAWAMATRPICGEKLKLLNNKILTSRDVKQAWVNDFNHLRNLYRKLGILATIRVKDWIVDQWEHGYQFDAIRPARYSESMLFMKIPKLHFFSATITERDLKMLGVYDDYDFFDYPSTFDPSNNPIMHVPTVRVNHYMSESDKFRWLMRGDQIIARRLDRRGVWHTVSFDRARFVGEKSSYKDIIHSNKRGDITAFVVERFKKSRPPALLVSPSVSTGYDFSYDEARYNIIGKVPWPDINSKIIKARMEIDKFYAAHIAMKTLIQMAGRIDRAEDDWGETFVIDDGAPEFIKRYGFMAPGWFHERWSSVGAIPAPREMDCECS